MLGDDAFIRKLPLGLDDEIALFIETLVYSADAIELSYNAIKDMALVQGEKMLNPPRKIRVNVFMSAWTIVDCLHVARQKGVRTV